MFNMTRPTRTSSFPPAMLRALETAQTRGELRIPCESPKARRLDFYALGKALRLEGRAELFDGLGFYVEGEKGAENVLILRRKEFTAFNDEIEAALGKKEEKTPSSNFDAEAALERILAGAKV